MASGFTREPDIVFTTKDHPEANGRTPKFGEQAYQLRFLLEDDRLLEVRISKDGWSKIGDFMVDELAGTPSYDDGSLGQ
jgi:hypothetical protein